MARDVTGLDSAFLYLDHPHCPANVGGLFIYEHGDTPMNINRLREHFLSRLYGSPVLFEKLTYPPLGLTSPVWEEDKEFDIRNHLLVTPLSDPNSEEELKQLSAKYFNERIPRSGPLWRFYFVPEFNLVKNGKVLNCWAMIQIVHHAASDGITAADLLVAILDPTPNTPDRSTKAPNIEPISAKELRSKAAKELVKMPVETFRFYKKAIQSQLKNERYRLFGTDHKHDRIFGAPKTVFNQPLSGQRNYNRVHISLPLVKNLKAAIPNATVNDISLAVCAGAMRSYLQSKNQLPEKDLTAFIPISKHGKGGSGEVANQISGMIVNLHTTEKNPVVRLKKIINSSRKSRQHNETIEPEGAVNHFPYTLGLLGAKVYSKLKISSVLNPMFNCVITNIAGPPVPLYLAGSKLVDQSAAAPLFEGVGLSLCILSYNNSIGIGVASCVKAIPEMDEFCNMLLNSLYELEMALFDEGLMVADSEHAIKMTPKAVPAMEKQPAEETSLETERKSAG